MIIEIKIPGAGESVTEAAIGSWQVEDGSFVEKDQEIAEVETDKATLPLIASESGKLRIMAKEGVKVQVGEIACTIDTEAVAESKSAKGTSAAQVKTSVNKSVAAETSEEHVKQSNTVVQTAPEQPKSTPVKENTVVKVTPLAQTIMDHNNLDIDAIINGLKKITRHDVEEVLQNKPATVKPPERAEGEIERAPMSPLRRKLAKRLVAVKNETAMLTTFNEVDMSPVMEMRKRNQVKFLEKHGQKLGMVSFFAMACTKALQQFPRINSFLDGDDILTPKYIDIAIAVQTDKGLMAPVIRNTGSLNLAQIELAINEMAQKARSSKLSIEEMTGGTFTITNGGIFGSMLSTPILNPPQSAILGMHNIVDRAVVVRGKIEIRPIMYVALSYDHRLIDGRESVSFLVKVKELIESPVNMLLAGTDPEKLLLDL